MADGQKPYRVYRGGRVKGKVPTVARPERERTSRRGRGGPDGVADYRGPGPKPKPKRRRLTRGRAIALVLVLLVLLFVVWGVAGFLSFRSGVNAANRRLERQRARGSQPAERAAALAPERHPAARHRPRRHQGARGRSALGLDHARADRSRPPPDRHSSRSRATCAYRSRATASRRSTRRTRSAARRSRSRPSATSPACRSTTSSLVDFANFKDADRRDRRGRRQRAGADPLEPVRLPVHAGEVQPRGRAGASRRARST